MKNIILTLIAFVLCTQLKAQKLEVYVEANSGLFHYSGNYAVSSTVINWNNPRYTNDPYGNKNGVSYGFNAEAKYVFKSGFIIGSQAGYQILRSKVTIIGYQTGLVLGNLVPGSATNNTSYDVATRGQTYLQNNSIYINPYIGYRLNLKKIKVDLMPGIDVAFNTSLYDKGKATDGTGGSVTTDYKLTKAPTDTRLKFAAAASYNRLK